MNETHSESFEAVNEITRGQSDLIKTEALTSAHRRISYQNAAEVVKVAQARISSDAEVS